MGTININGKKFKFNAGETIFDIAIRNKIYIPHLCSYPGLESPKGLTPEKDIYCNGSAISCDNDTKEYEGCGLCVVEIINKGKLFLSCSTFAEDGMVVETDNEKINKVRKEKIKKIVEKHPSYCVICPNLDGCDRKACSMNVPEEERCCWKFDNCEFIKVARYIGIENGGFSLNKKEGYFTEENPIFTKDFNLCIGCLRCVIACKNIAKRGALGFVYSEGKIIVGLKKPTIKESKCILCGICVEVCPTGALKFKKEGKVSKFKNKINPPFFPKKKLIEFIESEIEKVPATEGVFILYDENEELYKIVGSENLKESLKEEMDNEDDNVKYFLFEKDSMFTSRERQLIQEYLNKHGNMPRGNDILDDDLF